VNQPSLSLPSFAKVNWSLQILGKRPDGYHEIQTILQTISLRDELTFERREGGGITLSCDDPEIPTGNDNLVVRAAQSLAERFSISDGVHIHLVKRIPTQGGLGGGSSNAAVTLLALTRLWNLDVTAEQLAEMASSLGADVPFFLRGGCAVAKGIGTNLSSLPDGETRHVIVIYPQASVSTAEAYNAFNAPALTSNNPIPILSRSFDEATSQDSLRVLANDFEPVIFDMEPEVKRAKLALLEAGAQGALLAGSGSSVFGIFADRAAQQRALNEIQSEAGWRVFDCVTVSRIEYFRALS
jgi:4-diphosphocytidyl-2-C-methyl-D-erythritol kinase